MKTKQSRTQPLEPQQQALSILERPGQPLDAQTRAILEPMFEHNFGDVQIHNDSNAHEAAEQVNARAFTYGQHIVMSADQYAPSSPQGMALLAHELAHTMQQPQVSGQPNRSPKVSQPNDATEVAAHRAVRQASSATAPNVGVSEPMIARSIWDGQDVENDFWGTKSNLGQRWGGTADAAMSTVWDIAGFSGIGAGVSAGVDVVKAGAAYATGHDDAATRFAHDAVNDASGMIPIWGQGTSGLGALWDGASTIDRALGNEQAPLFGDILYQGESEAERGLGLRGPASRH
jgi:Domain of unknown function (DUF4157)